MNIRNPSGEKIDFTLTEGCDIERPRDILVLLGHGLTGNKNRPLLVGISNALNQIGLDTLRFSFSGNGASEGRFEDATISKEADDLKAIIDAASEDYDKIFYVGHSMGGAVGVYQAARDPRIQKLVTVAGMVDTKTFAETEFDGLVPGEDVMWEDPSFPLSKAYLIDQCETIVSLIPQAKMIDAPWLLVHGSADDVVLPADTQSIAALDKPNTTIQIVEGADHSFSEPTHKTELSGIVTTWLQQIGSY
ncbi:MAG: alpha/beta fold hydrolase [Verrucomicrobiota bacterium]